MLGFGSKLCSRDPSLGLNQTHTTLKKKKSNNGPNSSLMQPHWLLWNYTGDGALPLQRLKTVKAMRTSCYSQHPHDAYDGGIDRERGIHFDFLQRDPHDGEENYGKVQLVPPCRIRAGKTKNALQRTVLDRVVWKTPSSTGIVFSFSKAHGPGRHPIPSQIQD